MTVVNEVVPEMAIAITKVNVIKKHFNVNVTMDFQVMNVKLSSAYLNVIQKHPIVLMEFVIAKTYILDQNVNSKHVQIPVVVTVSVKKEHVCAIMDS